MEVTRDERLVERVMQAVRQEVRRHAEYQEWVGGSLQSLLVTLAEIDTKALVIEHRAECAVAYEPEDLTLADDKRCDATIDHKRCRLPYGHDSHRGDGILWMPSADRCEVEEARWDGWLQGLKHGFRAGHKAAMRWPRMVADYALALSAQVDEAVERETSAFVNQEKVRR